MLNPRQRFVAWLIILLAVIALAYLHTEYETNKAYQKAKPEPVQAYTIRYIQETTPPTSAKAVKKKKKPVFKPIKSCRWTRKQQKAIWRICRRESYGFELTVAQAKLESTWRTKAVGDGGQAYGAWQIHPAVWQEVIHKLGYIESDMLRLKPACEVYTHIMQAHAKKWDNLDFALRAWRWGGGEALEMVDRGETSEYASKIIKLAKKYERRRNF